MKVILHFFTILNLQTFFVVALSMAAVFLCDRFSFTINMPTALIGVAIVFPIVFSINAAYRRREEALSAYSSIRAHTMALIFAHRDWVSTTDRRHEMRVVLLVETLFDNLKAIFLECDRPFTEDDFQKSLIYRGVMCIGLYFADLLQYKNIVLLGVDLHTYKHFFDDYDAMKERKWYNEYMEKTTGGPFESMVPKDNKFRKMDEYYYSVNELYFKPKGVNLYVGNKNNMLSPRIPLYPEFE